MKVSVIIPVYNGEKYLGRCLDSVVNQTYKDIEIICINDGSKDKSIDILNEYKEKYSNIKVIDQENMGVAKTRNKAINIARGEYLFFVDNDDFIDEDYIETFVNCALENNYDVVLGGFRRVSNNTGKTLYYEKLVNTYYSRYIIVAPWARIIRRKFLIDNKIEYFSYGIGEDIYFSLVMYSKNPKLFITSYIGYNQSYNEESVSNTKQKGLKKNIDCTILLNKIRDYFNGTEDDYVNFYYHKYIIWYLLFSGRDATKEKFLDEYHKLFDWEKENIKAKILNPFSSKLKGEFLKTKFIIFTFNLFHRLNLMKLFARIYCKGENNE